MPPATKQRDIVFTLVRFYYFCLVVSLSVTAANTRLMSDPGDNPSAVWCCPSTSAERALSSGFRKCCRLHSSSFLGAPALDRHALKHRNLSLGALCLAPPVVWCCPSTCTRSTTISHGPYPCSSRDASRGVSWLPQLWAVTRCKHQQTVETYTGTAAFHFLLPS